MPTPNLDHLSPFEVAIGRKAILALKFQYKPTIPITGTHVQAKEKLDEKLKYFRKQLEVFRSNRNAVTIEIDNIMAILLDKLSTCTT